MHLLLNSTRSMGEIRALFSWCRIQGFRIERVGGGPRPITPEMLCMESPEDATGAVEWGGFRTRIEAGPSLTGSITILCGPDLRPPALPLEHVGALFTGDMDDSEIDELRKAGGQIHVELEEHTNLLIVGETPDPELVASARERGSILIWDRERFSRLQHQLRAEWGLDSGSLGRVLKSELRHRSKPLRAALKTRDPVTVDSAVDLFIDGAHGAIIDTLLDGVDWLPGKALCAGELVPNSFFTGSGLARPTMERALRRLIAKAPESARETRKLAKRVTSLRVVGEGWLDLSTLSGFPALEWLQISPRQTRSQNDSARLHTTGAKALATLPRLRRLELKRLNLIQLADLPLDGLTQLQVLKLVSCPIQNIQGAAWLSGLESLQISIRDGAGWTELETIPLFEVEELTRLPLLKQLSLHRVQINQLPAIPGLEELELGMLPDLKVLSLQEMPVLKRVHIRSQVLKTLVLSDLPEAEEIRVESGALKELNCRSLGALRKLRAGDYGLHPRPVLKKLHLESIDNLEQLELSGLGMDRLGLPMMPTLHKLQLQAPSRSARPGLSLDLESCSTLEEVELLGRYKSLKLGESHALVRLSLQGTLEQDLVLKTLPSLEQLLVRGARDATGPRKLSLSELPQLKELQLGGGGTESIHLDQLPILERMILGAPGQPATRLKVLELHSRLSHLRFLLIRATEFEGPEGRTDFPRLRTLDLSGCVAIRSLDWVAAQTRLQALHARGCELLEDARGLVALPELVHLDLRACELLRPGPNPALMKNRDEVVEFKKKIARSKSRAGSSRKRPSNRALQSGLRRAIRARDSEGTIDAIEALRRARSSDATAGLLEGMSLDRRASTLDLFASHVIEDGADQPVAQAALWRAELDTEGETEPRKLLMMRPNRSFEGKADNQALRSWAMVKLLAMVPRIAEDAHLLRESINGIHLSQCPDGVLPRLASFTQLRTLSVGPIPGEARPPVQIENLEPLGSLSGLRELRLQREHALQTLQGIESLELEALVISDCPSLEELRGLAWQTCLKKLSVESAVEEGRTYEHLVDLSPLRGLKALEHLCLQGLSNLSEIKVLAELSQLRILEIHAAAQLVSLAPLTGLEHLEEASLCGNHKLTDLAGLTGHARLHSLRLAHCHGLQTSRGLGSLPSLQTLDMRGCESLEKLELQSLPELQELDLSGCHQLEEVFALAATPKLQRLLLSPRRDACMDGIGQCSELQHLALSGEGIEDVDFLEDLEKLHTLSLHLASVGDLTGLLQAPALQRVHVSETLEEPTKAILAARPEVTVLSVRSEC